MDSVIQRILQHNRATQAEIRRDIAAYGLPPQKPHTNWEKYSGVNADVDHYLQSGLSWDQAFAMACAWKDTVFHPPPGSPTNDFGPGLRGFELLRMAQVTEDFIDEFLAHEGMKITNNHDLDYNPLEPPNNITTRDCI